MADDWKTLGAWRSEFGVNNYVMVEVKRPPPRGKKKAGVFISLTRGFWDTDAETGEIINRTTKQFTIPVPLAGKISDSILEAMQFIRDLEDEE